MTNTWRCFHCNEVFNTTAAATEHFGQRLTAQPACQIDITEYRTMEARMHRYNEEDSDMHREIHRMESDHRQKLLREEEKGYARGMKDASAEIGAANGLAWAVQQWNDEVSKRPMVNVHRRSLDDAWRQVIRYFGGDPEKLIGPNHDELRSQIGSKEWEAIVSEWFAPAELEEKLAKLEARADAEPKRTEDECFVAEHMLQLDFEMLDDNGDVYGCTLGQVLALLRARGGGIERISTSKAAALPAGGDLNTCTLAPNGWRCTRQAGHEGACAAIPVYGEL